MLSSLTSCRPVVIVPTSGIDALIAQGELRSGSRVDIVKSGIGVATSVGATKPDTASRESLKTSLLTAKSIVLSSGPSSLYLTDLFQKMGVAEQIAAKVIQIAPGLPVSDVLARGEGELGFTQISELVTKKGINCLGPLPADIQKITVFSAGIPITSPKPLAAKAWVQFLAAPEASSVFREYGLDSM